LKKLNKELKLDYNKEIREYNNLTKKIQNEELKLEECDKKIASLKYKQITQLSMITPDFISHFNDLAVSVNSDVLITIIDFFGFTRTPYSIIKVLVLV
jgi:hypothetical protein